MNEQSTENGGTSDNLNSLVGPIGAQMMRLKPEKRRCPECLGNIAYSKGCGGRKVPECPACNKFFPRGYDAGASLALDSDGTVCGYDKPNRWLDGK